MVKLRDVAKRAKVSEATASLVLNRRKGVSPQTRERVLLAMHSLGYSPNSIARWLAMRRTHSIGLVVTDIENPFFGSVARFVSEFILTRGYTLVLSLSNDEPELEEKIISYFIGRRVEGVIIVPTASRMESFPHLAALERHKIPFVFSTAYYPGVKGECVMTDLRKGSYLLTRYLLGLGHRSVLFLVSNDRSAPVSLLRIEGLEKAYREAAVPMDRLKIVECDRTNFFCGYSSTQQTLDEWKPDAIIAINDIMALGAERAVRERGLRIPDDVSVCGYDDVIFSRIAEVPLTTVRQDIKGICEKTVHVLFSRITGKRTATAVHWIQPELVVRTSAGPRAGTLKGSGKKQHEKI